MIAAMASAPSNILSQQLHYDMQITVRVKECPESRKSIISKVPDNPHMLKLNNDVFTFDYVKWGNESQERVYKAVAYPFVEKVLQGQSATILAFGPTGTGKSYTMGTLVSMMSNWQDSGLIQRCLKHIFEERKIKVSASFVEIYDGKRHDLLNMGATVNRSVAFASKIEEIRSLEEGLQLVNKALGMRQEHNISSSLLQNISSSQSHALLTLHLEIGDGQKPLESKLNLIDLSGSRIVVQTVPGSSVISRRSYFDESLSALEGMITRISSKSNQLLSDKNDTLATILKDLLDTKCLLSLVACISSDPTSDRRSTIRTLQVAESVKIQQRVTVTSDSTADQLITKSKELSLVLSVKPENNEINHRQNRNPIPTRSKLQKIKNCMVVLKKSDVKCYMNKKGSKCQENTTSLDHTEVVVANQKVSLAESEAVYSAETQSTLSISKLQTQTPDPEILPKADLFSDFENNISCETCIEDNLSMSSSEDMSTVNPATLHIVNNDTTSSECQCAFRGFHYLNELVPTTQQSSHQNVKEKQSILADNVSQLSISGQEIANLDHQSEKPCSSSPRKIISNVQLFEKQKVSQFRANQMIRMQAVLTTDFSAPGPSQIDYQTPRKIIKLDKENPTEIFNQVGDSLLNTAMMCSEDGYCDNIENQEQYLKNKQKVHNTNILRILNTNTAEELIDLPQIGFKTAVTIYQYRLIYGNFKSLKQLRDMPFWTEKTCNRFFAVSPRIRRPICSDYNQYYLKNERLSCTIRKIYFRQTTYFLNSIQYIYNGYSICTYRS